MCTPAGSQAVARSSCCGCLSCSAPPHLASEAREYMKWLFEQLEGPVYVEGWQDRDDCTVVEVPADCIGYVTGARRAALGGIEEEWGVLMFFMNRRSERGRAEEPRHSYIDPGSILDRPRIDPIDPMSAPDHKAPRRSCTDPDSAPTSARFGPRCASSWRVAQSLPRNTQLSPKLATNSSPTGRAQFKSGERILEVVNFGPRLAQNNPASAEFGRTLMNATQTLLESRFPDLL